MESPTPNTPPPTGDGWHWTKRGWVRFQTFKTHTEAEEAMRQENWAMTPQDRIALVETLRMMSYAEPSPRLQRVLTRFKRA